MMSTCVPGRSCSKRPGCMIDMQRDDFGKCLLRLGSEFPDLVVLDADNSLATRTYEYRNHYPERFINVGVAEQNLVGIAAGLALSGMRPLASTFAIFLCGRGFEAIRNSIALDALPVTLVGTHAGVSVGRDGASHFAIEDVALMRSLPNMSVVVPADAAQINALLPQAIAQDRPTYLRISRWGMPNVTPPNSEVRLGDGMLLADGSDCIIFCTGLMAYLAMSAADSLRRGGVSCAVACIHTLKPIDSSFVLGLAERFPFIITAEEHSRIGGLFSAIMDTIAPVMPRRCVPVAVNDMFVRGGGEAEIFEHCGLTSDAIVATVLSLVM